MGRVGLVSAGLSGWRDQHDESLVYYLLICQETNSSVKVLRTPFFHKAGAPLVLPCIPVLFLVQDVL